ncbi:hypothetical protein ABEW34_07585 [Paenibacillus algorifonticola]|uniref:hypothetical protein n=1 Tax=Paenibacillus algorifonticola TaxID=684063 RepID=UPI003D28F931
MDKQVYCRFCNEKHIVSETKDNEGNAVGLFCNRRKALIVAFTARWDGEDTFPLIERYVDETVDILALRRITPDKMTALSRKIAYGYVQGRKLNYYFVQHHVLSVIRSRKGRAQHMREVY